MPDERKLENHILLHHSQTDSMRLNREDELENHILLHHSQTSNSKMNCHHPH